MSINDYLSELDNILTKDPLGIDDISDASQLIKTIETCPMTNDQYISLRTFKKLVEKEKLETLFGCPKQHSNRSTEWLQSKNRLSILMNSRQQLLESEQVGQHTLDELASQEETILRTTKRTQETNSKLSLASKLATKMNSIWR